MVHHQLELVDRHRIIPVLIQVNKSGANANNAPVSRERIAGWITELLSSSTREGALMELSRKREKVTDLAVLLWHSFGSVAVLLHEVM